MQGILWRVVRSAHPHGKSQMDVDDEEYQEEDDDDDDDDGGSDRDDDKECDDE